MSVTRNPIAHALLASIGTMLMPLLAGCGSGSATATSNSPPETNRSKPITSSEQRATAAQPPPKLLPGAKTVALERAGDRSFDKTFDDLRFELDPGELFRREMLTKEIEALNGEHVRIRGFILPTARTRGIKQFILVRDNQECCFGPGAALYDCIVVEMQPGKTAEYSIRPVAVAGMFDIHELVVEDRLLAIYHLKAESVE